MTEDLVLLAVTGDTCTGPAHLPARERRIEFQRPEGAPRRMRCDHRMQSLEAATTRCNGFVPLHWPSLCGEVEAGHIYVRTDLTVRGGECFMCVAAAAKPVRAEYGRRVRRELHEGAA